VGLIGYIMGMIIQGNSLDILSGMKESSIDCCVTSPPYWGLRDYGTPDVEWPDGWKGSLGLESDFLDYIRHLMQIMEQVWRVLKPTGTCWVNLGDSYSRSGNGSGDFRENKASISKDDRKYQGQKPGKTSVPAKSLCAIPDRFKIAMIDAGWVARSEIIWFKRNCMPSSAKDRFTVDFEKVFFFTKQGKYYFKQQLEQYTSLVGPMRDKNQEKYKNMPGQFSEGERTFYEAGGRNRRCVWDIPTKPSSEPHFAMFPDTLVEPMLSAGCPVGGVVLDPFSGMGTVGMVANRLGMDYVGIELSEEYAEKSDNKLRMTEAQMSLF